MQVKVLVTPQECFLGNAESAWQKQIGLTYFLFRQSGRPQGWCSDPRINGTKPLARSSPLLPQQSSYPICRGGDGGPLDQQQTLRIQRLCPQSRGRSVECVRQQDSWRTERLEFGGQRICEKANAPAGAPVASGNGAADSGERQKLVNSRAGRGEAKCSPGWFPNK